MNNSPEPAYELGIKSRFADGRIQLNGAVFYNDNKNLQSTDIINGVRQTINSGESDTTGFELDVVALLAENWIFNAALGYADTDHDLPGRYTTPLKTANAGIEYQREAGYGYWTARLDATYMGETRFSISEPRVHSDPRTLLNARVGLAQVQTAGGEFRFAVWGKNLTDEEYIVHGAHLGGFAGYTWGRPRSYGVDVIFEY